MVFRKKNVVTSIGIIYFTLLFLSSCFQSLLPRGETGSVIIHIAVPSSPSVSDTNSDVRFIHPDTKKVKMTVTAPDMETITETKNLSSNKSEIVIEVNTIPSGINRNIQIKLYDGEELLAKGSTIIDIQANVSNVVSITAIPETKNKLDVGVASGAISDTEKGKTLVYSVDVSTEGHYLLSSDTSFDFPILFNVYNNLGKEVSAAPKNSNSFSLSAGKYYVSATLPSNYAGGSTIKITETNPGVNVTVSFENPTEPTFSWTGNASVAVNQSITISAATEFTSYQWYLNGVVQMPTTETLTLMASTNTEGMKIPGDNILTLVVESDGKPYSSSFKFTVTQ